MRCSHPHYALDLGVKENGKRALKFVGFRPDLSSLKQLSYRYGEHNIVPLPCGQCLSCRLNKAKEWAVRCVLESLGYDDNYFITLTYDDDHLPKDGLLVRKHVQDFLKRARKVYGSFRYFGCGEYGTKNKRPHYHLILFGCKIDDLLTIGNGLYESKSMIKLWPYGFNTIGFVSYASCNYVARYSVKKVFGDSTNEFLMMSTKPGIGYDWMIKNMKTVMDYDSVTGSFGNNSVANLPRYFDKIAELLDGDSYKELKAKRLDKSSAINIHEMITHNIDEVEILYQYNEQCTLNEFIRKKGGKRL